MTIRDGEQDYIKETEEELRSRITQYLMFAKVQEMGYDALLKYGINYRELPEFKDNKAIDQARRMKPNKAQELVVNYLMRVEHAILAAVRRKQLRGINGGLAPTTEK